MVQSFFGDISWHRQLCQFICVVLIQGIHLILHGSQPLMAMGVPLCIREAFRFPLIGQQYMLFIRNLRRALLSLIGYLLPWLFAVGSSSESDSGSYPVLVSGSSSIDLVPCLNLAGRSVLRLSSGFWMYGYSFHPTNLWQSSQRMILFSPSPTRQ